MLAAVKQSEEGGMLLHATLVAPYRAILRYYDTFSGRLVLPQFGAIPL